MAYNTPKIPAKINTSIKETIIVVHPPSFLTGIPLQDEVTMRGS
jgi:hypothetical protein